MQISQIELDRLNFYRASELHGGLVLGQLVRRARDPWLIQQLTQHSAEELRHSQVWTETILAVGGRPVPLRATYQTRLAEAVGAPASLFQVLALTQVFERRVYRHFIEHDRMSGTHPTVRMALQLMIEEERQHLCWVRQWLEREAERRGDEVRETMQRYQQMDDQIYNQLVIEYEFRRAA
jgi:demethoxyubiquinone hydroxylase (CLK1/Coq7/Cat5 family)